MNDLVLKSNLSFQLTRDDVLEILCLYSQVKNNSRLVVYDNTSQIKKSVNEILTEYGNSWKKVNISDENYVRKVEYSVMLDRVKQHLFKKKV